MKNQIRYVVALTMAVLLSPGFAETWYFNPTKNEIYASTSCYDVNNAANWTNSVGETGVPADGDTVVIDKPNWWGKITSKNNVTRKWGEIWWNESYLTHQYWLCFRATSVVHLRTSVFQESGGMIVYGEGEFEIDSTANITFAKDISNRHDNQSDYTTGGATFVKTGPWKLTCFRGGSYGSNRDYGINYTKLREGTINLTTTRELSGKSFMFCGPLKSRFEIGTSDSPTSDLTLSNSTLSEDNEAIGSDHGFTSSYGRKLIMKGTPGANPMVFTGKFFGDFGFEWNPDSSSSEFVFSNAVSETTGDIVVGNGIVRFSKGAGTSALGSMTVGATGKLAFDAGADVFTCGTLALETGAKVVIPANVYRSFSSVTYDGSAVADGLYTSATADWVEGDGFAVVGTGSSAAATAATWNGTGNVTTLANWSGAEALPALDDGSLVATVSGGASMNFDADAYLRGIVLGVDSFALTADAGKALALGTGGLSGTGAGTYDINAPMMIAADQTWAFSGDDTINFNSAMAIPAGVTFSVTGGTANVTANNAIGSSGGTAAFEYRSSLHFAGGTTNDANVLMYNGNSVNDGSNDYWFGDDGEQDVVFDAGGETVMNGCVGSSRIQWLKMYLAENAQVTVNGGVYGDNSLMLKMGSNSRLRIVGKPLLVRNAFHVYNSPGSSFVLELAARGNSLGFSNHWQARNNKGTIKCLVPYALEDVTVEGVFNNRGVLRDESWIGHFEMTSSAILDLCGNDQSLKILYARGGFVTSEGAAMMRITGGGYLSSWDGNEVLADKATWTGGAGLSFAGKDSSQKRFMMKESSTTGILEVVQGTVVMTAPSSAGSETVDLGGSKTATRTATGGRWPNASAVVVKGGTLEIEHSKAFGRTTNVFFESNDGAFGKIRLPSGVCARVCWLYVDGVRRGRGRYGSSSAPNATATDDAIFEGEGCLNVCGPTCAVILR